MKKTLFLAAATFALAACNNDGNYIDEPVAAQISATIGESAVSRASGTSWAEGDRIGVTMTGNNVAYVNMEYITTGGDGLFSGATMYFKNHKDPVTLTAYYPFSGSAGTTPDVMEASTTYDLQTPQEQVNFDFLYAKLENVTGSTPNVEFRFSHQMGKLTFIFTSGNEGTDVSKITSYTIDGLILDGTFDTESGVCAVKQDAEAAPLRMATTDVTSGGMLPSLIVFPQATAGKTVRLKIHDSDNQDYACELKFGDNGIEAGNNYQITIKVSKTGLNVDYSIAPWTLVEINDDDHTAISDDSEEPEEPENQEESDD